MRDAITFTAIVYLGLGVILWICAAASVLSTREFLDDSVTTSAEVVSFEERLSSEDDTVLYAPVFRYQTASGRVATFVGRPASNPPFDVGDVTEVAYRQSHYSDVRNTSFYSLWGLPVGLGAFGAGFAGVGGGIFLYRHLRAKRDAALRRTGTVVQADFRKVELNRGLTVDGHHPWRIVAHWMDPAMGVLRVFYSDNIWFDPTLYITNRHIIVYVDPEKPSRYCMDLSFLPTLAA